MAGKAKRSPGIPDCPPDLTEDGSACVWSADHFHSGPSCQVHYVGTNQGLYIVCDTCHVAARAEEVSHRIDHKSGIVARKGGR